MTSSNSKKFGQGGFRRQSRSSGGGQDGEIKRRVRRGEAGLSSSNTDQKSGSGGWAHHRHLVWGSCD